MMATLPSPAVAAAGERRGMFSKAARKEAAASFRGPLYFPFPFLHGTGLIDEPGDRWFRREEVRILLSPPTASRRSGSQPSATRNRTGARVAQW